MRNQINALSKPENWTICNRKFTIKANRTPNSLLVRITILVTQFVKFLISCLGTAGEASYSQDTIQCLCKVVLSDGVIP